VSDRRKPEATATLSGRSRSRLARISTDQNAIQKKRKIVGSPTALHGTMNKRPPSFAVFT
jgi:hypothetical protein